MNNFEKLDPAKVNAEIMELAAIWLSDPIQIVRDGMVIDLAVRIKPGDEIRVENDQVVKYGLTNYKVESCLGNINNSILMFEVRSLLDSNDHKLIKL